MKIDGTVIAGALTGLAPVILNQLNMLGKKYKKDNSLSLVSRKVDFVSNWIKAQEALCTPEAFLGVKARAIQELEHIQLEYAEVFSDKHDIKSYEKRTLFQRLFLLYWPHGVVSLVWQVLFFGVVGMLLLAFYGWGLDPNDRSDFNLDQLFRTIITGTNWLGVIIFLAFGGLFRYLSVITEKKWYEAKKKN
jgi:hypothetical protein